MAKHGVGIFGITILGRVAVRAAALGALVTLALTLGLPSATGAARAPRGGVGTTSIESISSAALAVSAGLAHSCGLRGDGTVGCWGDDSAGQATAPAGTFTTVSAGGEHNCGLRTNGTVACWGSDGNGQAAAPAGTFSAVGAGLFHSCAIKADGTVACWGANFDGQASPPTGTFTAVAAGGSHSCGIKTGGTVACWGANGDGQATPPAGTFAAISAGESHSCGVKTDGTLACWGLNGDGQVSPTPAGTFIAVSAGQSHSCGLKTDGSIACWGSNSDGQSSPVPAGTFSAVSAGGLHSCGLKTDGSVVCWGSNSNGQLGAGPATPSPAPVSPADAGVLYSHTFTSAKGSPAASFAVTVGNLPAGLTLSAAGILAGTPTAAGTFNFTVTASNGLFPDASAPFSLTVNDTTPPVITPNVTGTLGADGWYTSSVFVTWTVSEPESPSTLVKSGCGTTAIIGDTTAAGTSVTCQATSAGGSKSVSVTIKRDATPPTISCQTPPVFALNASPASVSASLADQSPGSGPGSLVPASPQAADTTSVGGKSVSYSGSDNAGNSSGPVACAYSVVTANQTIAFGALPDKLYGDPDFTVTATASSGLAVSFAATGSCTVGGATVHLTGAGSCTLTASQAGNASYNAAPDISRVFSIAKASQTITFGALADTTLGAADFTVSATASSGLAVSFAASGSCTLSGATVHLTAVGTCTIAADQLGNANFSAATSVARSFTITKPFVPPTAKCTVPKVVGKTLAAAKLALKAKHCAAGTVSRAYSKKTKKGRIVSQSRRAGGVLPAGTKVKLVVSRGRRP